MNNILMIVDYEGKFRGNLPTTSSLNIEKIVRYFNEANYNVEIKKFNEIANSIYKYHNYYIIYTSVENRSYKNYLDDILYTLHSNRNFLIPRYELFRAHDNKAYQEIIKREVNISSNFGKIYCKLDEIKEELKEFKYPLILKSTAGAVSKAVYKIDNEESLKKVYDSLIFSHKSKWFNIKRKFKSKFNYKYDKVWYDRENDNSYVVIQKFIKNLDGDWKVIVFGDKYYVLKRGLKPGDFKASGSGILDFKKEPPKELLDFAKNIYKKLDTPFISLDIAIDKKKNCYLLEFQALHFGPLTVTASKRYYTYKKNKWNKVEETSELEKNYVDAYLMYVRNKE